MPREAHWVKTAHLVLTWLHAPHPRLSVFCACTPVPVRSQFECLSALPQMTEEFYSKIQFLNKQ